MGGSIKATGASGPLGAGGVGQSYDWPDPTADALGLGGNPSKNLLPGNLTSSDPFDKQETFHAQDRRIQAGKTQAAFETQQTLEEEQLHEDAERLFKGSYTPNNQIVSSMQGAKNARGHNAIEQTRERRIPDQTIENRNLNLGTRQGGEQANTGKQYEAPKKLGVQQGSLPYRPGGEGGFFITVA